MHKTSAVGTTDIDAMEFIPLIIGESDIDIMEFIPLIKEKVILMQWNIFH